MRYDVNGMLQHSSNTTNSVTSTMGSMKARTKVDSLTHERSIKGSVTTVQSVATLQQVNTYCYMFV